MTRANTARRSRRDRHWLQHLHAETVCKSDAAEVLNIDPRTLTSVIDRGDLAVLRTPRKVLILRQSLLDLLGLDDLTVPCLVETAPELVRSAT